MIGICSRRTNVKSFDPCVEVSVCWNRYGNAIGGAATPINQSINVARECQKGKTFLPCCQWERIVSRRTIRLCQRGSVCRAVECLTSVRACITCKITSKRLRNQILRDARRKTLRYQIHIVDSVLTIFLGIWNTLKKFYFATNWRVISIYEKCVQNPRVWATHNISSQILLSIHRTLSFGFIVKKLNNHDYYCDSHVGIFFLLHRYDSSDGGGITFCVRRSGPHASMEKNIFHYIFEVSQ